MVVGYHRRGFHPLDARHGQTPFTLLEPQNKRVCTRWANKWAVRHLITDVANGVTSVNSFMRTTRFPRVDSHPPSRGSIHHAPISFSVHLGILGHGLAASQYMEVRDTGATCRSLEIPALTSTGNVLVHVLVVTKRQRVSFIYLSRSVCCVAVENPVH